MADTDKLASKITKVENKISAESKKLRHIIVEHKNNCLGQHQKLYNWLGFITGIVIGESVLLGYIIYTII
jgi:F0F1-type ATP synthase assembly protein I